MQLDSGAVHQIARSYHGYHKVNSTEKDNILRFVNDLQDDGGSKLEIDCLKGTVVIKLNTPLKGKTEVVKTDVDYKTLHQVFQDPRCFFIPPAAKLKRRGSRESSGEEKLEYDGPAVFTLSSYNKVESKKMLNMNDFTGHGLPFQSSLDLGIPLSGLRVPTTSVPKVPDSSGSVHPVPSKQRKIDHQLSDSASNSTVPDPNINNDKSVKTYGPAKPDPSLLPSLRVDQELLAMDTIFRTKTSSELNYLKRKRELDKDRLKRKAELSHRDKVEGFNSYLSNLPEFNEQRKINWSKH